MQDIMPQVYLISRPAIDWGEVTTYLESIGAQRWLDGKTPLSSHRGEGQDLAEIAGRLCYKSWEPGLNLNVSRVRKDQGKYLENILASGHGSVLEHANYTFILQNVSRVFTHEIVRHRVGVAISQESLRYVRADELKLWLPDCLKGDDVEEVVRDTIGDVEDAVRRLTDIMDLNNPSMNFEEKKKLTSALRRILPQGMATDMLWTANIRTLRHCIEMRTSVAAEVEMPLVFNLIGNRMATECPSLFGDYYQSEDGSWSTQYAKV